MQRVAALSRSSAVTAHLELAAALIGGQPEMLGLPKGNDLPIQLGQVSRKARMLQQTIQRCFWRRCVPVRTGSQKTA